MSQTYHITSVKDTSFDPDAYGNKFYSIEVQEFQGALLWKTKNRPEVGAVVYGHTEPSKTGKSMLFKKDKQEDGFSGTVMHDEHPYGTGIKRQAQQDRSEDIRWGLSLKEANAYVIANRKDLDADKWASEVIEYAKALYKLSETPKSKEDEIKEFMGGGQDTALTAEEFDAINDQIKPEDIVTPFD